MINGSMFFSFFNAQAAEPAAMNQPEAVGDTLPLDIHVAWQDKCGMAVLQSLSKNIRFVCF